MDQEETRNETDENNSQGATAEQRATRKRKRMTKTPNVPVVKKVKVKKKAKRAAGTRLKRTRAHRPYPAAPFSEVLPLAQAIQQIASGEKVKRETLLKQMNRSAASSSTKMLITNSGKYGLTTGSYTAEYLDLTEDGRVASNPDAGAAERLRAQFRLAVEGVAPFNHLYKAYVGKKLPTREVMKDLLEEGDFGVEDLRECVDTFVVNAKELGLLREIAGAETLVALDVAVGAPPAMDAGTTLPTVARVGQAEHTVSSTGTDWAKTCFYVTPIGAEGSDERRHADLFLNHLVEPALEDFGLHVVRADKIGEAGMITSQIVEHLLRSRLVIVDMSFLNPNVFYEMAVRHASKLPVVQIIRKANSLPFDVNQVRTVVVDTTDIFSLVPRLQTYQSEIAAQVRAVLGADGESNNPLTVFFPGFGVTIPPLHKAVSDSHRSA